MGSGKDNVEPRRGLVHIVNQGLDTVVGPVGFPGRLVFFRKNTFYFPQIHKNVPISFPLVITDDHLTLFFLVLRIEGVFLNILQGLPSFLLGRLYRHTVEVFRFDLDEKLITDLRFFAIFQGFFQGDFRHGIVHIVHNHFLGKEGHSGSVLAELNDGVFHHAEFSFIGRQKEIFDGTPHQIF